jgi:hypothetical protein
MRKHIRKTSGFQRPGWHSNTLTQVTRLSDSILHTYVQEFSLIYSFHGLNYVKFVNTVFFRRFAFVSLRFQFKTCLQCHEMTVLVLRQADSCSVSPSSQMRWPCLKPSLSVRSGKQTFPLCLWTGRTADLKPRKTRELRLEITLPLLLLEIISSPSAKPPSSLSLFSTFIFHFTMLSKHREPNIFFAVHRARCGNSAYMISGFRRGLNRIFALQGFYAAKIASFLPLCAA